MYYPNSYYQKKGLTNQLRELIGQTVQFNSGGPEKGKGTLLKMSSDYYVLQCDEGIFYYPMHHVKSYAHILEDSNDDQTDSNENKNESKNENSNENEQDNKSEQPIIVPGKRFVSVIDRLKGQEIQINRGGPHKIKGTVVGRNRDSIILEVDGDTLFIPLFHIQSMCWNYNNSSSNDNQQNKNNSNDNKNKNNSKDSKNENKSSKNNKNYRRY
ncbi:MAG: hypothetical protein ACE3JP_14580 [Ectobacillus sp.]